MAWSDAAREAARLARKARRNPTHIFGPKFKPVKGYKTQLKKILLKKICFTEGGQSVKKVASLMDSMRAGMPMPGIEVSSLGRGEYMLDDGHHRARAARMLRLKYIMAHVSR